MSLTYILIFWCVTDVYNYNSVCHGFVQTYICYKFAVCEIDGTKVATFVINQRLILIKNIQSDNKIGVN